MHYASCGGHADSFIYPAATAFSSGYAASGGGYADFCIGLADLGIRRAALA